MAVEPLAGALWGVLATPFAGAQRDLDEDSLRREVRLFRRLSATGVVALGVFGEAASLTTTESRRVIEIVCAEAGGLPVVAGLPARATQPAVEQARAAAQAARSALAAVMVQVNTSRPDALREHLTTVYEECGVPLVVQDYPVVSGVRIAPATLADALIGLDFVVAVKSEAPPTATAIAVLVERTGLPVFGGLGGVGLLDELAAGAAGAMTGFSHPEGLMAALRAWRAGGFPAARQAFAPWLPLVNFEAQPDVGLAVRKECLRRRGILTDGAVRAPAAPLPPVLAKLLTDHLAALPDDARQVVA